MFCGRPQGGGAKCEGFDRKYQACTAQQCFNVPRITVREFAEQYCTRAKEVDKDLTGTGLQKISSDRKWQKQSLMETNIKKRHLRQTW